MYESIKNTANHVIKKLILILTNVTYLKKKRNTKRKKNKIYSHYIFFDFETKIGKLSNQHVVNLAEAKNFV